MTANAIPNVSRVAPWFGADTAVAAAVGRLLGRRKSTAVPFCGGLAALAHINTRTGIATDKHRHIINYATAYAICVVARQIYAEAAGRPGDN